MKPMKHRQTRWLTGAAVVAALVLTTSCGTEDSRNGAGAPPSQAPDSTIAAENLPPVTEDFTWPAAQTPEGHYPVTVTSCNEAVTFDKAPERAVVNDANMVEMMFALGLSDHMAAYAAAGPRLRVAAFEDDYAAVKDLGDSYFKLEPTMAQNPDFVFSGWNYGFSADGINPQALSDLGVKSYVLSESCRRIDSALQPATIDEWYGDMRNLGAIFGVPERAEALIRHWQQRLDTVEKTLPAGLTPVPTFSYGFGTDGPGGGLGLTIVPELYRKAGAVNVFEDLKEMWGTVSWEAFVEKKPELIVVTDYGSAEKGQSGEEKIAFLKAQKGVDTVPAIAQNRFLVLPQSAVNPGIRMFGGIEEMAAYLYPNEFAQMTKEDSFGLPKTYDART